MAKKAYLSTIHPAWSLERQRALLGPDAGTEYVDEFGPVHRKRRDPAVLKDRAALLRPTSRQDADDLISVAAPSCFAFSPDDFSAALAAAATRGATVRFLDTGTEIPPRPETQLVDQVARQFAVALRRRGLHHTREEIAEQRRKDTLRRIALIADDWPKREHSTQDLLARAGTKKHPMAPATAKDHLGSRPEMQRNYDRERAREAGRRAARERKRQEKAK